MAIKLKWLTPTDTDIRRVRVEACETKTGTFSAVATIDATSDAQQKGANNSWVLEYIHSGGASSTWYQIVFINSDSAETTSDKYSEFPNVGRPYAIVKPGLGYLKGFDADTWQSEELEWARNAADTWIEGKLKTTWHDSYVPDQIVDIASKYACGTLIIQRFIAQTPERSAYGELLLEQAEALKDEILEGELALLEDTDGDGIPETFIDLAKDDKVESGARLKKWFDPTKDFHDLGNLERVSADVDGDWY